MPLCIMFLFARKVDIPFVFQYYVSLGVTRLYLLVSWSGDMHTFARVITRVYLKTMIPLCTGLDLHSHKTPGDSKLFMLVSLKLV